MATIILDTAYGYQVQDDDDIMTALANQGTADFSRSLRPGQYIVDIFPWSEPLERPLLIS
jgi:hypothetical protein